MLHPRSRLVAALLAVAGTLLAQSIPVMMSGWLLVIAPLAVASAGRPKSAT